MIGPRDAERERLREDAERGRHWKRWGPYLAERQWATVREDYSRDGDAWAYFPHDHARSRAYRWGEDGLLGICDHRGRLAFALALWNERDPILKERLFGLTGTEGNHGEDAKELYFYLDSTPTHSYLRSLYKYPQAAFPYRALIAENARRSRLEPEFELEDTGAFDEGRYFDVLAEYAKASPNDIAIRITLTNCGPEPAPIHVLPTLWFRNTWSWGRDGEGYPGRPRIEAVEAGGVLASHPELDRFRLAAEMQAGTSAPIWLFTENETNAMRFGAARNRSPHVKDAFHEAIVVGRREAVNPEQQGTKAALHHALVLAPGETRTIRMRLYAESETPSAPFGDSFEQVFQERRDEADAFYASLAPAQLGPEEARVVRQGYAGLLHTKQFYLYVVKDWLEGDPSQPPPADERRRIRNHDWPHLYNRDVISMPDKWEYPWYAAWDLAFHMVPFTRLDPAFAKQQLLVFLREWYMHPNGQIPAYEWNFSDVNPPVHAWAAWRIYKMEAEAGKRDRDFLRRVFDKLVMNFTWWVNRKDPKGQHLFSGGFLGLDNIGVFDRSKPLPTGGSLEQADGTAWMAFYCGTMLSIALELASDDPVYEDMASKFFEHFVAIVDAVNALGGSGLWDEEDGFYYDQLHLDGRRVPMRVRSLVGLIPLLAVEVLDDQKLERLPAFRKRMQWFLENRADLARHITYCETRGKGLRLLAVPSRERLERVLGYLLDEAEFLSPFGFRSLSKVHEAHPYVFRLGGEEHRVAYDPGESTTWLFGGNSNWRGPIWFPTNFLLLEALERYGHYYGRDLEVECPTGSGRRMTLDAVSREVAARLASIFLPNDTGARPWHGPFPRWTSDPSWRELTLFHEYFHADTGRGLGASHQTGWTALVVRILEEMARDRG